MVTNPFGFFLVYTLIQYTNPDDIFGLSINVVCGSSDLSVLYVGCVEKQYNGGVNSLFFCLQISCWFVLIRHRYLLRRNRGRVIKICSMVALCQFNTSVGRVTFGNHMMGAERKYTNPFSSFSDCLLIHYISGVTFGHNTMFMLVAWWKIMLW